MKEYKCIKKMHKKKGAQTPPMQNNAYRISTKGFHNWSPPRNMKENKGQNLPKVSFHYKHPAITFTPQTLR